MANYSPAALTPSRIASDGQIGTDFLKLRLRELGAASRRTRSPSRHCKDGTSREQGREIELHFVDKPGIESLAQHVPAAFDQHTGDLPPAQIGQNLSERFPSINQSPARELIGKKMRRARQFAGARKNDAPRLARPSNSSRR